jgi:3-hydroxyisobutyrate dehydrogenase-like beta-hydroxyacid dehydrogenase
MNFRIIKGAVGRASSIKMVRSIMVKGLEALTAECALAAHAADVMDEVFPSLRDGHPNIDVQQRAT